MTLLEESFVSFTPEAQAVPIHNATIVYPTGDPIGVLIAVQSLASDLESITGKRLDTVEWDSTTALSSRHVIFAGTVDSPLMQQLNLDLSHLRGKWETFTTTVIDNPLPGVESGLVIAGSDKRGAIFGIHTLAEQCGQSPFHWWLDITPKRHDAIFAPRKTTTHGEPHVKYRGIFINDEAPALMTWWARKHNTDYHPLDSEFYRHVFDLMLRLRANFLWPAMWPYKLPKPGNIFFTADPGNQQLADDYGIVVSTSHHEPMQRATNEWDDDKDGLWDWTQNKDNVASFMEEGVRRAGDRETYFTLGMRAALDGPLEADDPAEVLRDVFATQRDLLKKAYGDKPTKQAWTIYKEVATYYAAGLDPPDDVTLIFPDDNFGNIQRLPTGKEREREGGIGLYFHLEYVGNPESYKWQNSNNLAKVLKELHHAKYRGADRIWVINVGDIKPMELPLRLTMDLAWGDERLGFSTIPDWATAFASRTFGTEHADQVASILLEYSRLVGRRRFEGLRPHTYSLFHYYESERVLNEWKDLAARAVSLADTLSADLKSPFYHLIQYPVTAGYTYHAILLGQGRNKQYADEKRNSTNQVARQVLADFEKDFDLVEEYDQLVDGKWSGIMLQPRHDSTKVHWDAPFKDALRNLSFVQLRQDSEYEFGNLAVYGEGSEGIQWKENIPARVAPMDPYGPKERTLDIVHRGNHRKDISWSIKPPYDWITVSPDSGVLSSIVPEQRAAISIDWTAVPEHFDRTVEIRIEHHSTPSCYEIYLPVTNRRVPTEFVGFPETAGMASIEGPRYQRTSPGTVAFERIRFLGSRSESGSVALRPYQEARASVSVAQAASTEYDVYLFSPSEELVATVYINMALDTDPKLLMEYSLTLDDAPPLFTRLLGDPESAGDVPPEWVSCVQDQVWVRTVPLRATAAGKHTLVWRANSPEIYLEKIVLSRGALPKSYLGPPATAFVGL